MTVQPQTFKITHFSHVIDDPLQSQEKDLHVEYGFCLQTREEKIVY